MPKHEVFPVDHDDVRLTQTLRNEFWLISLCASGRLVTVPPTIADAIAELQWVRVLYGPGWN